MNGRKSWDKVRTFGAFAHTPHKHSPEYSFTYLASPTTPRAMLKSRPAMLRSRPATGHFRVASVSKGVFVGKQSYETVLHTTRLFLHKSNIFSCERFCTTATTRFKNEAQDTSKVAYFSRVLTFL